MHTDVHAKLAVHKSDRQHLRALVRVKHKRSRAERRQSIAPAVVDIELN